MCGRFTQAYTWEEVYAFLNLLGPPRNLRPRYNIAPTTTINVMRAGEDGRELIDMRWGLVPGWWRKPLRDLPSTFNARAETIDSKPMFRSAFKSRRCIIPASGFYEWRGPKTDRRPFYISAADGAPVLAMAGLWESWRSPDDPSPLLSATIIVTEANKFMSAIHDRMPVFLVPQDFDAWLSGVAGTEILRPADEGLLQAWPVSTRVNKTGEGDDDPTLIERLAA